MLNANIRRKCLKGRGRIYLLFAVITSIQTWMHARTDSRVEVVSSFLGLMLIADDICESFLFFFFNGLWCEFIFFKTHPLSMAIKFKSQVAKNNQKILIKGKKNRIENTTSVILLGDLISIQTPLPFFFSLEREGQVCKSWEHPAPTAYAWLHEMRNHIW